jgi:hypothetical protein
MNKMTKCDRCDAEYKEYCDGGSFVEYEYEKPIVVEGQEKTRIQVLLRGLYDGTNKSRMWQLYAGIKLGKAKPYNFEFFLEWDKFLQSDGCELVRMCCENYIYRECNCDKSIVGEPLGDPLK